MGTDSNLYERLIFSRSTQAIRELYPNVHVQTEEGLFWAGGMRKAWEIAVLSNNNYDLYWLVNDDTLLYGVEVKFYNMEVKLDENLETQAIYVQDFFRNHQPILKQCRLI